MEIAILIAQILLRYGPDAAKEAQIIFASKEPAKADWSALFAKALEKSYDDYVTPKP